MEEKDRGLEKQPKGVFQTFKLFLSTKGCNERENIHLNVNGNVIKDQKQVAEVLVEHFATLADGIGGAAVERNSMEDFKDHASVQKIQQEYGISTQNIEIKPVTQGQVLAVLESLNTNKATGSDGIPPKALKIGAQQLAKPLTTLFNSCLSNNVWPSVWKKGDWTPVYKKRRQAFIRELQADYHPPMCKQSSGKTGGSADSRRF